MWEQKTFVKIKLTEIESPGTENFKSIQNIERWN
jgi:hypothetical protein